MSKLKRVDIEELTNEELGQRIEDDTMRYQKMKFNHQVSPLDDPQTIKFLRRDIARLKTELIVRQSAEAKSVTESEA